MTLYMFSPHYSEMAMRHLLKCSVIRDKESLEMFTQNENLQFYDYSSSREEEASTLMI